MTHIGIDVRILTSRLPSPGIGLLSLTAHADADLSEGTQGCREVARRGDAWYVRISRLLGRGGIGEVYASCLEQSSVLSHEAL